MKDEPILINEIIKHTDYTTRIMIALATVGVASDGQLVRLCLNLSEREEYLLYLGNRAEEKNAGVLLEASRISRTEGYVAKEANVRLPKQMGGGSTNVWYLTAKGVAKTHIIDPYFTRYATAGMPCGTKKDRIPHELAVTESFLKLVERQTVCDFIPERELKRRIMKRRHELRRQGVNPNWVKETSGEETGDFRAILRPKNDERAARFEIEGEAAINYRRTQIEAKPDKMLWFVTSKTQKEMVVATKKERLKQVWILENVCKPFAPEVQISKIRKRKSRSVRRNKLENKINEYLLLHPEAFTGRALAGILKEQLSHVSEMLKRLGEKGYVESEEIKLTPARHRGRPNKLFWHTENDEKISGKRSGRVKSLVISETISFFSEKEYRFTNYTEAARKAEFVPLEKKKYVPLRVIIESPELTKDELRKKIEAANFGTQNPKIEVVIAVSTQEKYEEIKSLCRNNIVLLIEKKSIIEPEKTVSN